MRVSVTYDVVTEASAIDGDHADHGYIQPDTETRRSYARGGKRQIDRNVRMSRAGRFDWKLRDAIEFIATRACECHETCWVRSNDTLSIRACSEYQGCDAGKERINGSPVVSVSYDLHIDGVSFGTLDRLARMFARNGVYFANVPALMREAVEARKAG
jgi:hypothetical protein